VLIEDGILRGYMHDRLNAGLSDTSRPATAAARSFAHLPMPRMTNTIMLAGERDPAEIIAVGEARPVRGQLRRRPGRHHERQVRVLGGRGVHDRGRQGHVPGQGRDADRQRPDALTRVSMVGNDLELDSGIGTCGKEGQSVRSASASRRCASTGSTVGGTS
jgi:TldD protein